MNKIFFTADFHFGHKNVLKHYTSLGSRFDDDRPNHDAEVIAGAIWEPVEMIKLQSE